MQWNDFVYHLRPDGLGLCLDAYLGQTKTLTIPGVLQGMPVVEIGENALHPLRSPHAALIRSLTLSPGIQRVGQGAFQGMAALETVSLPAGLLTLGVIHSDLRRQQGVFLGCGRLAQLALPDSLQQIGDACLDGCEQLREVSFGTQLRQIGAYAFSRTALQRVSLPDSLETLGDGAFLDARLQEVDLGQGIRRIGKEAFSGCRLCGIHLPASVEEIGENAFSTRYGRSQYTWSPRYGRPYPIQIAADHPHFRMQDAFLLSSDGTTLLQGINCAEATVPEGIKAIAAHAWRSSELLQTLRLPASLVRLHDNACQSLPALRHLVVYDGIAEIGRDGLALCGQAPDHRGVCYGAFPLETLDIYSAATGAHLATVPYPGQTLDAVRFGGEFAQSLCQFWDGPRYDQAVHGCKEARFRCLAAMQRLQDGYRLTPDHRQRYVAELQTHLPLAVQICLDGQRMDLLQTLCSVVVIEPEVCQTLLDMANQANYGEAAAILLSCRQAPQPKGLFAVDFFSVPDPEALLAAQWKFSETPRAVTVVLWRGSDTVVSVPSRYHGKPVTALAPGALADSKITHLTLPDTITRLGDGVCAGCGALQQVTLPSHLAEIPERAFAGCGALSQVTLPDDCTAIGRAAFRDCTGLQALSLPDALVSLGEMAFQHCTKLRRLTLPAMMQEIPPWCFAGCSGLMAVTLPDGLCHIGEGAFSNCRSLHRLTFPSTLQAIGDRAFSGCTRLAVPDLSHTTLGQGVFSGCQTEARFDETR